MDTNELPFHLIELMGKALNLHNYMRLFLISLGLRMLTIVSLDDPIPTVVQKKQKDKRTHRSDPLLKSILQSSTRLTGKYQIFV